MHPISTSRRCFNRTASGWQTFRYGKLGEVTENIRTFALPYDNQTYTFRMNFEYDSWNRIQSMTYPDGEVVNYGYNPGGMLKSVSGTKMNHSYPYIDSIRYNEFELKEDVWYGNGAQCKYGYDILQRLSGLQSYTASNELMQNISYTYDEVGNITDIDNSAGILSNGLGGPYFSSYQYDSLYRLVHSDGNWLGSPNAVYELATAYHPNGRIKRKALSADIVIQTPMTNSFNPVEYDNMYHYTNSSQPNTLTYIDNGQQQEFVWDAKGNMVYHKHDGIPMKRFLCWDEQNRLQGVMDEQSLAVYQYDANGDRTYKLTGKHTHQNISGTWHHFYQLDKATLYASPYLVVTPKGYTKHYYAESERVASKLGKGGLQELDYPLVDNALFREKHYANTEHAQNVVDKCLHAEDDRPSAPLSYLYELMEVSQEPENERYFYHPDHLGSSSWITFTDGEAIQHLHYLPFGEDLVNQQHTAVGAMYTFSAKEKDAETGYSYFGSRYYNSDLSIWLSVDPMSDKYPSLSPYVYCANNPIRLVDPNGEEIYVGDNYYYRNGSLYYKGTNDVYTPEKGSFEEKALNSLNKLRGTNQGSELMSPFEGNTGKDIVVKDASNNPHTLGKVEVNDEVFSQEVFKSATIYWNPDGKQLFKTLEPNATTDLGHEFSHVYDNANGTKYPPGNYDHCPLNEWHAVYRENMIRRELGVPYRRGYTVLLQNVKDGTETPYLTKMLTPGGLPFVP